MQGSVRQQRPKTDVVWEPGCHPSCRPGAGPEQRALWGWGGVGVRLQERLLPRDLASDLEIMRRL